MGAFSTVRIGDSKMKKIVLFASLLATAFIFCSMPSAHAEGIGVPKATLEQGQLRIDFEGTYVRRELEQDKGILLPLAGVTKQRDNERMRSQRMYAKFSYGFYSAEGDGFFRGTEGFLRLGAANIAIQDVFFNTNSFVGGPPFGSNAGFLNTSFDGAFELAVGGGTKSTLYRQGPLSVGLTVQITYFENEDKLEFFNTELGATQIEEADVSVLENDIALAASYEVDAGNFGIFTPYLGVVGGFIRGDVDFRSRLNVLGPFWNVRTHSYKFDQEYALGGLVGVDWKIAEIGHIGVEGIFYGDGNAGSVYGGISF